MAIMNMFFYSAHRKREDKIELKLIENRILFKIAILELLKSIDNKLSKPKRKRK